MINPPHFPSSFTLFILPPQSFQTPLVSLFCRSPSRGVARRGRDLLEEFDNHSLLYGLSLFIIGPLPTLARSCGGPHPFHIGSYVTPVDSVTVK